MGLLPPSITAVFLISHWCNIFASISKRSFCYIKYSLSHLLNEDLVVMNSINITGCFITSNLNPNWLHSCYRRPLPPIDRRILCLFIRIYQMPPSFEIDPPCSVSNSPFHDVWLFEINIFKLRNRIRFRTSVPKELQEGLLLSLCIL